MRSNKGALTVEATIALSIFLMVFITILFVMRIVFAYGVVQHALNQTAKEFSTYSYYYAISGLGDVNGTIQSSTAGGISNFNQNVSNIVDVYDKFGELGNAVESVGTSAASGDISSAVSSIGDANKSYSELQNSLGAAKETIQSIANDPVAAIKSVGSVFLNGGNESAKTFICGELSRSLMAKYISGSGYDAANTRLTNLCIEGGLDGIDFSASSFWSPGGENDIQLVACYTIKPILPIRVIDEINLINRIKIRGWSGKSIF